ncbi:MAG: F0F1 ATP synthase subunit B [Acidobacteriota bacterium]|nr:F0F1 ATP synthase subunit B [Acidobacteriota bacterium]
MTQRVLAALWVLGTVVPTLPARAAEESGGGNIFAGDVGNALWSLVIFVLLLVVLGKFAWGPILTALKSREDFIRESLERARSERDLAGARLKEYEEKLAAARTEATAIVEQARHDAEAVRRKIEEDAKHEGDRMIERAKREIGMATEAATHELYGLAGRLATDIAARILGREVGPQDHERLIADSIKEIGSAHPH